MPQPTPRPLASAWVVVEAMPPVTASVASARAAILFLIDTRNSIRLSAARLARMPSWTERLRIRFDCRAGNSGLRLLLCNYRQLSGRASALRAVRKRFRIEPVDIGEQFAERACALIEQALAFLRRRYCGIAG